MLTDRVLVFNRVGCRLK